MHNIVMIVGLPGSGKTCFAKKHYFDYTLFDDVAYSKDWMDVMKNHLRLGLGNVVVTDHAGINGQTRSMISMMFAGYPKYKVTWVFFENDLAQCIENVERRNEANCTKRRIISRHYLGLLSDRYEIPLGHDTVPVYRREEYNGE